MSMVHIMIRIALLSLIDAQSIAIESSLGNLRDSIQIQVI